MPFQHPPPEASRCAPGISSAYLIHLAFVMRADQISREANYWAHPDQRQGIGHIMITIPAATGVVCRSCRASLRRALHVGHHAPNSSLYPSNLRAPCLMLLRSNILRPKWPCERLHARITHPPRSTLLVLLTSWRGQRLAGGFYASLCSRSLIRNSPDKWRLPSLSLKV